MKTNNGKKISMRDFYYSPQVMVLLRVDKSKLRRMRNNQEIPYLLHGRKYLYAKSDIIEMLQSGGPWLCRN